MVEPDEVILNWMQWGLAGSIRYLAKMPLYVERGHYPPEKLVALRQAVMIETRVIEAYREGTSKGLSPEERVWAGYVYGWACVKIKQYAAGALEFESYREEFQALWDRRDAGLVALGLPPYGENYERAKSTEGD